MSAVYQNTDPQNGVKQCPICLEDSPNWTVHGDKKHILACLDCIKNLDRQHPICPICREELDPKTYLSWKERNIEIIESMQMGFVTSVSMTAFMITILAMTIFFEFDPKALLGSMLFIYTIGIIGLIAYIRNAMEEQNI